MRTNEEIVNILKEEKDKQGLSISELARRAEGSYCISERKTWELGTYY